jgi:hypothetical protein
MSANHVMRLLFAAFVALVTLTPAPAALAVPPTHTTVFVDDTFEDPSLTRKCGFPVQIHLVGPIKAIRRFDQAGNPVQEIQVAPGFRVTFSANGNSLTTPGPAVALITLATDGSPDIVTAVGLLTAVHLPGQGVILLDTGKIEFYGALGGELIAEAGPHELFGSGDATQMCNALAGI